MVWWWRRRCGGAVRLFRDVCIFGVKIFCLLQNFGKIQQILWKYLFATGDCGVHLMKMYFIQPGINRQNWAHFDLRSCLLLTRLSPLFGKWQAYITSGQSEILRPAPPRFGKTDLAS
jgi:hypothetical protein